MKSEPSWQLASPPRFAALKSDHSCDVVVIGGGITGLTAACELKSAGKSVCLLERDRLGSGDTGCTTAHLTYVTDVRPTQLKKNFGGKAGQLLWQAGSLAIDTIESISREAKIDCEFQRVPGFLCAPFGDDDDQAKSLKRDAEVADEWGLPARFIQDVPYLGRAGVQFPNQAKFHPLKYLAGLAKAVDGAGSRAFENSEATEIKDKPLRVTSNGKTVRADYIVIATHVPLMGKSGLVSTTLLQTKIFPYSSYVIGAKVPKGLIPQACFWDISDPYYYLRVDTGAKQDYVIFGGEDHKTGQEPDTEARFRRLESMLTKLVPQASPDRRWSGQVIETNDGLPFIGEMDGQFVATGFSGNGITFGTLAGLMAKDAALKRENPWQKLLSVDRKRIRGGTWDYLSENVDYPYYYVRDRLAGPDGKSTREVKRGQGKVLNLDGQKVACSRDDDGKLHTVSAYCTHMGCIVRWNAAEKTWDCPCHGSRFQPDGKVAAGPAESPLEPIASPERKPPRAWTARQAGNGRSPCKRSQSNRAKHAKARSS